MTAKIWRVYNNGDITNETHLLSPNGYNGDVKRWSEANAVMRFGCAQIVQYPGADPQVLFHGYLDDERLQPFLNQIKTGEIS